MIMTFCSILICLFALPVFSGVKAEAQGVAGAVDTKSYFKDQLSEDAKVFYNALEELCQQDTLKTGVGSKDITANLDAGKLTDYIQKGDSTLPRAFQAARDAFAQDHVDLFYIDFTKISLRVGVQNNTNIAFVGNGANANYYAEGFTQKTDVDTALQAASDRKTEILKKVKDNKALSANDRIKTVHDELVDTIDYTYPSATDPNAAGIYGALVEKKANCVGYASSFKWILDELNIPNILVSGTGVNSQDKKEAHMWNYVQIEGAWFAVDATWDDPTTQGRSVEEDRKWKYFYVDPTP